MGLVVHLPYPLERFELCHPRDEADFETIHRLLNGEPRQATWNPIEVELIHRDRGRRLQDADAPWLGSHALVLKPNAAAALREILLKDGELLPLECAESKLEVYNPRVVDALDEGASSSDRLSSGRIVNISRHVFRPDPIRELDAFKIPNLRVSPIFLSERFVRAWGAAGLKGLRFEEVWREE
jgi:hypothetical protein